MTDLSQINMMLGPANRAISDNLKFLRNYKPPSSNTDSNNQEKNKQQQQQYSSSGGTMSAEQALYIQNLTAQMNQMLSVLFQMGSILQKLHVSGTDFNNAGLSEDQLTFLRNYLATVPVNPPSSGSDSPS